MTTKIKTTLLTAFFFFGLLTGLQAQDKYEYATIDYYIAARTIIVSTSTGDYEEVIVDKNAIKNSVSDYRPALKKVVELEDKGWELYQSSPFSFGKGFYMRKKKN